MKSAAAMSVLITALPVLAAAADTMPTVHPAQWPRPLSALPADPRREARIAELPPI